MVTYHDGFKVALAVRNAIIDEMRVLRHVRSLDDQRRVRGGILGLDSLDGLDVSRVADDDGVLLELLELGSHGAG